MCVVVTKICDPLPFGAGIIFLILSHSVYKMGIIQELNMLEL